MRTIEDEMVDLLANLPEPRSAWLVMADEKSVPDDDYLLDCYMNFSEGDPDTWTCSPRIEEGDLLFIYCVAPRKAIHFVTRALSLPRFQSEVEIEDGRRWGRHQWWVEISPIVEIEPIPFSQICEAEGRQIIVRGQSGKWVSPQAANQLMSSLRYYPSVIDHLVPFIIRPVVGSAAVGDPASFSLKDWSGVPSSLLRLEREVEDVIVEPLLRLCNRSSPRLTIRRQHHLGRRVADFVVYRSNAPACVLEVKQRVIAPADGETWELQAHYQQLVRYAAELGCNGVLIDADQIYLFDGEGRFVEQMKRRDFTKSQLARIRAHIAGEQP